MHSKSTDIVAHLSLIFKANKAINPSKVCSSSYEINSLDNRLSFSSAQPLIPTQHTSVLYGLGNVRYLHVVRAG